MSKQPWSRDQVLAAASLVAAIIFGVLDHFETLAGLIGPAYPYLRPIPLVIIGIPIGWYCHKIIDAKPERRARREFARELMGYTLDERRAIDEMVDLAASGVAGGIPQSTGPGAEGYETLDSLYKKGVAMPVGDDRDGFVEYRLTKEMQAKASAHRDVLKILAKTEDRKSVFDYGELKTQLANCKVNLKEEKEAKETARRETAKIRAENQRLREKVSGLNSEVISLKHAAEPQGDKTADISSITPAQLREAVRVYAAMQDSDGIPYNRTGGKFFSATLGQLIELGIVEPLGSVALGTARLCLAPNWLRAIATYVSGSDES